MIDLGLLVLRLGAGGMMAVHGIGKAKDLLDGGAVVFPDPIGIGATPSLALATFAELICALAVAAGFKTRFAAVPVVITMLVAGILVHAKDDWATRELAFLFAAAFLTLVFTGGGRHSIDSWLAGRRGR